VIAAEGRMPMNEVSKEYVQGILLMAFIGIPVLWSVDAISGSVAFIGMLAVMIVGTANNNRKSDRQ
jgi:hypothetical protein